MLERQRLEALQYEYRDVEYLQMHAKHTEPLACTLNTSPCGENVCIQDQLSCAVVGSTICLDESFVRDN